MLTPEMVRMMAPKPLILALANPTPEILPEEARAVRDDAVLYAHASRILHLESNPGNARALVQRHGDVDVWLNPPPLPLAHAPRERAVRASVNP